MRVLVFCTAWLTLGAIGEISGTDAQRDVDTGRSIVLDTAVLHADDVVQRNCTNTGGECWSTGGPGGMGRCLVLHHETTSVTRNAGLLQELLNFSFEGETVSRMAQFDGITEGLPTPRSSLWRVKNNRHHPLVFEKEAELNSLKNKTLGVLVIGIDSAAARSVVPAGEIPGYLVEKDSEIGHVYTSATGEGVFDQGKQQILGTVDGKVRGLSMRVRANQEEPYECVRHVCGWTSCRVRFRRQQKRLESCGEQADWRENLLQVAKSCGSSR